MRKVGNKPSDKTPEGQKLLETLSSPKAPSSPKGKRAAVIWQTPFQADPDSLYTLPLQKLIGVALCLKGPYVAAYFAEEGGVHIFKDKNRETPCLVEVNDIPLALYQPPADVERPGHIPSDPKRRVYHTQDEIVADLALNKRFSVTSDRLDSVIRTCMDELLQRELEAMVES